VDARPAAVEGDRVVIGIDPEFASNREGLLVPRAMKALQQAMKSVLGRDVSVDVRVLESFERIPPPPAGEPADDGPAAEPEREKPAAPRTAADWAGDPVVRRAIEEFNGSIIDIRE